jgi:poly(A) polymerase
MNLAKHLEHQVFQLIASVARSEELETYVIGGFVRDLLIKESGSWEVEEPEDLTKDIDIVVIGSGIALAEKVRSSIPEEVPLTVFRNFGTAMLKWGDTEVEFVGARKESYRRDSRKPLVEDGSLEDDQNRRDFTINALAISLNPENFGTLLDPFGGLKHLEEKLITTPLDPGSTFSDDPLRMLRGIRFATRLGFTIEAHTFEAIFLHRERIRIISQERISDELNKIMMCDQPGRGFILLDQCGLLEIIFPELHAMKGVEEVNGQAHKDNFFHTLEVLDNLAWRSDNLWLRWGALLHDIAKPRTKKFEAGTGWTFHAHEFIGAKMIPGIFRRLKLPLNEKMKYVQKLVQLHLRPIVLSQDIVTDSAVRRLIFDAGDDLEDLMTLCEADITSKNERTVKRHLKNFQIVREKIIEIEAKDSIRNFQPPISGDDIQKIFGIPPSRAVGIIKNAIKEAILDGKIPNEYQAAYELMLKEGAAQGLSPQKGATKEETREEKTREEKTREKKTKDD